MVHHAELLLAVLDVEEAELAISGGARGARSQLTGQLDGHAGEDGACLIGNGAVDIPGGDLGGDERG